MAKLNYEDFIVRLLETIEEFNIEDFKNFIVKLGVEKDSSERQTYLDFINEVLIEEGKTYKNVMSELKFREENGDAELIKEVIELYNKVRDGFYDGYWEWDPEYHEERMMGDDSWAEEAADLFLRTECACVKGEYQLALKTYEMLFAILRNEELPCHGDYESMMDIDLDRQRDLFLLCIYFSNNLKERPIKIMNAIDDMGHYRRTFRLSNIINAYNKELPEFHEFIKLFINKLLSIDNYFYKELLIDTVFLDGGIEGIKEFARENYGKYPEAYLFFVTKLIDERIYDDDKVIEFCKEALLKIPRDNKVRDSVAKVMINTALKSDKTDIVMEGIKEAFYSNPGIENLVLMLDYGRRYNWNEDENVLFANERLVDLIKTNANRREPGYYESIIISAEKTLHLLFLLSNQVMKVLNIPLEKVNDESYLESTHEIIKVFLLILLSKENNKHCNIITRLLNENVDNLRLNEDIKEKFLSIIFQNIQQVSISDIEAEKYIEWCISRTTKRVNKIVSNQHRGLYDRAAEELIACAEMIANVKGKEAAYSFINSVRACYPRHISFAKSVNMVLEECNI